MATFNQYARPICHLLVASIRYAISIRASIYGIFTSCCLHFCRYRLGAHVGTGLFQGSKIKLLFQIIIFYEFVWPMCIMEWLLLEATSNIRGVCTSYSLFKCCCSHWEIGWGSCWHINISRVKGQALIQNSYFLWVCVTNMNYGMVAIGLVRHLLSMVFLRLTV